MPTSERRRGARGVLPLVLVAAAATAVLAFASNGGSGPVTERVAASQWRGLVGGARPTVDVGQRVLVVLNAPSLAQRVAAAGGLAGDRQERAWTTQAYAAQRQLLSELATHGLRLTVEYSYARVLNGFSAAADPRTIAELERSREVAGVYPIRVAYPASLSSTLLSTGSAAAGAAERADVSLPGFDGRGVTVALLDTGVDRVHPYLRGRVQAGFDAIGPGTTAAAAVDPTQPGRDRAARHRDGRDPRRRRRPGRVPRRRHRRVGHADPGRGLAARRARQAGRLRADRPAPRRPRARGRPERGRRRARRRAHRAHPAHRAVRGLRGQPRVAGRRRRVGARHARRDRRRERRAGRAGLRQRVGPRRRALRPHRRRRRRADRRRQRPPRPAGRPRDGARRARAPRGRGLARPPGGGARRGARRRRRPRRALRPARVQRGRRTDRARPRRQRPGHVRPRTRPAPARPPSSSTARPCPPARSACASP